MYHYSPNNIFNSIFPPVIREDELLIDVSVHGFEPRKSNEFLIHHIYIIPVVLTVPHVPGLESDNMKRIRIK